MKPKLIVETLDLLKMVSEQKQEKTAAESSIASIILSFTAGSQSQDLSNQLMPTLIQAPKCAYKFIETLKTAIFQACLYLIISYLTLHLSF